eukprot:gene3844-4229_t
MLPIRAFFAGALSVTAVASINGHTPRSVPLGAAETVRTFGTGKSAFQLGGGSETTIFDYNVSSTATSAALTHFWITGRESPRPSGIDNATIRIYVDSELAPSIEFLPPMACGVGFDDMQAPWGTALIGHGATDGAWYLNFKIPFGSRVVVTAQAAGDPVAAYIIVRGAENIPLQVGALTLPIGARLRLQKIVNKLYQPVDWVPVVDVPSGGGMVLMHTLAVRSSNKNFLEGCYHFYETTNTSFPGVVLSTGTEDYFDSAYYFDAGQFHLPVSGCPGPQACYGPH